MELGYVYVALIVERQWHQRIRGLGVLQRNSRCHSHHAVIELILRTLDAVIVQKAERDAKGVRRLVPCIREYILEAVEWVADLFHVNGRAEAVAQGVFACSALTSARPRAG